MENKDRIIDKGYQKYVEYCTHYKFQHSYDPRSDMMLLSDGSHRMYYIDEFEELVNRNPEFRKRFIDVEIGAPDPIPVDDRNWNTLESIAESIVKEVQDGSYHEDNDDAHYMYEAALTAIYGDNFWDWFRKNTP